MNRICLTAVAAAALLALLALPCGASAQKDLIIEEDWVEVFGRVAELITPQTTVPPDPQAKAWPIEAVAAPATVEDTVPLYEQPDTGSAVLMEYYSGARLTALRPVGDGFWRVQAGEKGASVTGYMRAQDLHFGREAQREVQPAYMELRFNREATIYSYCDTGSTPIGVCDTEHTYYAMSRTDGKWVQLFLPPVNHIREQEDRATAGFVYMETGLGRGYWHVLSTWTVEPIPGDPAPEAVRQIAIQALLEDMQGESPKYFWQMLPRSFTGRTLEELTWRMQRNYTMYSDGIEPDWCYVYFWSDELSGTLIYWTRLDLEEEDRWEAYSYIGGNNEPGYTSYTFEL